MAEPLLIGWGEADATPENVHCELAGQYYRRISEGAHLPLRTVALLIGRGAEKLVMVSLDLVGVSAAFQRAGRERIAGRIPELRSAAIVFNVTHTHSAPYIGSVTLFREWLPPVSGLLEPERYTEFLLERVADAVQAAWEGRRPGGVAGAFASARLGHCRRPVYRDGSSEMYGSTCRADFAGMEGGEDSGVEMLFTFGSGGEPTGVIVNAACPSQAMEATRLISSDFMGAARELLREEFGGGFHTLCQVSAAGCQSPRDLVRGTGSGEPDFWHADGVPVLARRLADAVRAGFGNLLEPIDFDPVFRTMSQRVALPVRRASRREYDRAAAELAALLAKQDERSAFEEFSAQVSSNERIPGRSGPYDDKEHHFVQIRNRRAVVERFESQDRAPVYEFELYAVRIGRVAVATNPFELYLVHGQAIKARSRAARTLVVQLAGDTGGYLPGADAERLGGYGGMIINGMVGSEGGALLVDATVAAIDGLFA